MNRSDHCMIVSLLATNLISKINVILVILSSLIQRTHPDDEDHGWNIKVRTLLLFFRHSLLEPSHLRILVLLSLLLNGHSISIKFSWRWSNSFQPDSTDISPTTSIDSNQSNERKQEKVTLNWLSPSSFAISPVIPFISSSSRLIGFSFLSLSLSVTVQV